MTTTMTTAYHIPSPSFDPFFGIPSPASLPLGSSFDARPQLYSLVTCLSRPRCNSVCLRGGLYAMFSSSSHPRSCIPHVFESQMKDLNSSSRCLEIVAACRRWYGENRGSGVLCCGPGRVACRRKRTSAVGRHDIAIPPFHRIRVLSLRKGRFTVCLWQNIGRVMAALAKAACPKQFRVHPVAGLHRPLRKRPRVVFNRTVAQKLGGRCEPLAKAGLLQS